MVDLEGQLVLQLSAMSPYLKNCDFVYLRMHAHYCICDIATYQTAQLCSNIGLQLKKQTS